METWRGHQTTSRERLSKAGRLPNEHVIEPTRSCFCLPQGDNCLFFVLFVIAWKEKQYSTDTGSRKKKCIHTKIIAGVFASHYRLDFRDYTRTLLRARQLRTRLRHVYAVCIHIIYIYILRPSIVSTLSCRISGISLR